MKDLCIIVPVYNVETYLVECIESIVKQMDKRCELLLIDDGSTDDSGNICDSYIDNDCVSVVHKSNSGVASARNVGIELSDSRYICFVDADDIIADKCVERILQWIDDNSVDVCLLSGVKFYPDGTKNTMGPFVDSKMLKGRNRIQAIEYLSSLSKFPGSACTKLFRKDFLLRNNIKFNEEYKNAEDIDFVYKSFVKAQSFDSLDVPFYLYRQERINSASSYISLNAFRNLAKVIEENIYDMDFSSLSNEQNRCLSFLAYEYIILLWESSVIRDVEYSELKRTLKALKEVLKFGVGIKYKLIYMLLNVLGYRNCSRLLDVYLKVR